MMAPFRAIAMVLILALASSPALAAICATSCASYSIMSSLHAGGMSEMKNCHDDTMEKSKQNTDAKHKSCAMSAGCNFTQLTLPIVVSEKLAFDESTRVSFPSFAPSEKSVDLSPPLKPPA